jgi:gas vesicle protein
MNESFENRSSGKHPETQQINASRNLLKGLLAGVVIGLVAGVFLGRQIGHEDKKPEDNKSTSYGNDPDSKNSDCKALMETIAEMKRVMNARPKWGNKDTGVCDMSDDDILEESQGILDERREQQALELIAKLGIKNQADKDKIIDAFLKGYTQVDDVDKGDISLTKKDESDSGMDQSNSIDLEEELEEVPKEYLDEDDLRPKTPEEIEMKKLMEEDKFREALDSFDADKILKAAQKEGLYDLFNGLIKLIEEAKVAILSTNDPARKKEIACRLMSQIIFSYEDELDDFDSNPDLTFANKLIGMFMESLMKLAGVEDDDECIMESIKAGFECLQNQAQSR